MISSLFRERWRLFAVLGLFLIATEFDSTKLLGTQAVNAKSLQDYTDHY